jgi:hypothetical protein
VSLKGGQVNNLKVKSTTCALRFALRAFIYCLSTYFILLSVASRNKKLDFATRNTQKCGAEARRATGFS